MFPVTEFPWGGYALRSAQPRPDSINFSLSDHLCPALSYRLYPHPILSGWRRGSLLFISPAEESVYFNIAPPPRHSHDWGSQEMKRLRRGKLSSSPHPTFLVVIHSWQKPIHAPTAFVPADVWRRLPPPPTSARPQLPPNSVHTITSRRAGYEVWVWVFVIYIRIHSR